MSDKSVFVDANIRVYAHDRDAGDKDLVAKSALASRWDRPLK